MHGSRIEGADMEISGIISAIVIGIIIGVLSARRPRTPAHRHPVDDRRRHRRRVHRRGIASAFGVADTKGPDWIEWFIQIAVAAVGVAALDRVKVRR